MKLQEQAMIGLGEEASALIAATLADPGFRASELAQLVLDTLPDQVYVKDLAGRFVLVNAATAHFFMTPTELVVGRSDFEFFPKGLAEQFHQEEHALLHSGQPILNREAEVQDSQGRPTWLLTTKVALRAANGECLGLVGINHDITRRKQAAEQLTQLNADLARSQLELLHTYEALKKTQGQLVQAEKLESIGRLAVGIAHEIKNPLAILLMGIAYFEDTRPTGDVVIDGILHDMRDAVERADAIVRELLAYGSPRELETTAEDLNTVVDRALHLIQHELHLRHITLVREFAADLPRRRIDRIRIEQVFVNLFMNACQAMPHGGILTVRTLRREADVVVEVLDTGMGIPPAALAKVFDPFFTTKSVGVGTGMGLAVAKQILTQHSGNLELANRPTGGVQVSVTFHNGKEINHETDRSAGSSNHTH